MEKTKTGLCCGSGSAFGMWLAIGFVIGFFLFKSVFLGIAIGAALGLTVGRKGGALCCGTSPSTSDPDEFQDPDAYEEPRDDGEYDDPNDPW